jgi:hypothetical protein
MNALLNSLTESELALVRETERDRLTGLDEDGLVALHTRVRRARDKYVKLYRRQAGARVAEAGGRGQARPRNSRDAGKAEVFEDALSRVSRRLGAVARDSAATLKAERLAAARPERSPVTSTSRRRPRNAPLVTQASDRRPTSPAVRKRQAATLGAGARRQARRDTR